MQINLPACELTTRKNHEGKTEILDIFRKRFVVLTPEEWVRQHFLHFLVNHKHYPASLISVEKGLVINQMKKRFDTVVFNSSGQPIMLIEFKSQKITLSQKTIDQISIYNFKMKVDYLTISNGLSHYCCRMNYTEGTFDLLKEIPSFNNL